MNYPVKTDYVKISNRNKWGQKNTNERLQQKIGERGSLLTWTKLTGYLIRNNSGILNRTTYRYRSTP